MAVWGSGVYNHNPEIAAQVEQGAVMDINAYLEGFKAGYELAERERVKVSLDKYINRPIDIVSAPDHVVMDVFKNPCKVESITPEAGNGKRPVKKR